MAVFSFWRQSLRVFVASVSIHEKNSIASLQKESQLSTITAKYTFRSSATGTKLQRLFHILLAITPIASITNPVTQTVKLAQ